MIAFNVQENVYFRVTEVTEVIHCLKAFRAMAVSQAELLVTKCYQL